MAWVVRGLDSDSDVFNHPESGGMSRYNSILNGV